jgi:hypothetical protein
VSTVARVNVYLIEDEPLTLVDAGPNSGTSCDELQRGIEGLRHVLEDVELVISGSVGCGGLRWR